MSEQADDLGVEVASVSGGHMFMDERLGHDSRIPRRRRMGEDDASEAHAFAMNIARGPHLAWGYMKKNLLVAESEPLAAVLESEALSQSRCAMTDDHKEARAAFIEKRKPVFRGR